MPNIKSQKDRVEQTKKENASNKAIKSNRKTVTKKAAIAIADGSADAQTVATAVSTIDKAAQKGVISKNSARRKVSKMMKKANAAQA